MLFTVFAANAKTIVQHDQWLQKKNCNDKDEGIVDSGSQQSVAVQKRDGKWKVVGEDNTKRDYRAALARNTAIEPEISLQTKSRKKRNRRNRDRTASSATLDFRSSSEVREDSDECLKNRISETKSFHVSDKLTCKEKPTSGVSKQRGHAKPDRLADNFSCHSAGDNGRDEMARPVIKDELKPATVASFCPGKTLSKLYFCDSKTKQ